MQRFRRQQSRKIRTYDKAEGLDFVRCLFCGKHLRVISRQHLSTHGIDRKSYSEEYRLSPDQLCSKTFRVNHSSRSDYCPHNRREWIAAMKTVYKQHGNVYAGFLQKHYPQLYLEGLWLNGGDWDAALRVLGFTPERMRLRTYWETERVVTNLRFLREKGVSLYPAYVLKLYAALFSAALRILGSWPSVRLRSPILTRLASGLFEQPARASRITHMSLAVRLPVLINSRKMQLGTRNAFPVVRGGCAEFVLEHPAEMREVFEAAIEGDL